MRRLSHIKLHASDSSSGVEQRDRSIRRIHVPFGRTPVSSPYHRVAWIQVNNVMCISSAFAGQDVGWSYPAVPALRCSQCSSLN